MRHTACFIKGVSLKRLTALVLCCLLGLIACSMAQAQSGRRVSKRTVAAPAPPAETKQTPVAPVAKTEAPQLSLYVCMSERDSFMNIPLYLIETIRNVFVQRIGQASDINVASGPETHRSEAIKRAKAEESVYVVLLQLDSQYDSPRTGMGRVDESKLLIRYSVFAPVTGRTKAEGIVYQQQYRVGRGGIGIPSRQRNNPLYSDYLLKEAARDAADRVLEALSVYRPTRGPGLNGEER